MRYCNDVVNLLKQSISFIDEGQSSFYNVRAKIFILFFFFYLSPFDKPWKNWRNPCPRRCSGGQFARCMPAPYSNAGRGSSATFPSPYGSHCACQRSPLDFLHPPMIPRVCLWEPSKEWPLPSLRWCKFDLHDRKKRSKGLAWMSSNNEEWYRGSIEGFHLKVSLIEGNFQILISVKITLFISFQIKFVRLLWIWKNFTSEICIENR